MTDIVQTQTQIQAHIQTVTIHIAEHYPSHEPRTEDPHYKYFNAARKRLADLGKLVCWICGTTEQVELHHSMVEFALSNGVDIQKFETLYPEFGITTDEQFLWWVEGEGNLTPLCKLHHTGILGVHVLPYPVWEPQRFWKHELQPPANVLPK